MNLFEFDDYKNALKEFIKAKGKSRHGSFKNIAEYLGVHATLISQILSGPKDFTEEQVFSVCEYLGIPSLETKYLWLLVQIERAGSVKLKNHYIEMKNQIRKESKQVSNRVSKNKELTEIERAVFYSSWIYSAVHMATTLEQKVNFEFICNRFNLNQAKAREILDFLIQIGMVTEKDGILKPGTTLTHLEKKSPFLLKHHTNWRLKAIEAAENLSDEELMYSGNFSISKSDFNGLREALIQTIQKFISVVKESPAEELAQFNVDFFWLKK